MKSTLRRTSEKSSTSQTTGTIRFCTKGGNHRLLKQWKAEYGAGVV
ncbi:hypothetical protein [Pseudomonas syringae]